MTLEAIKAAFADETFKKELLSLETASQVQAALKEKGIMFTEEELCSIHEILLKLECGEISREQLEQWAKQMENGTLSEEALDLVSGGSVLGTAAMIAGIVAFFGAYVTGTIYAETDRVW